MTTESTTGPEDVASLCSFQPSATHDWSEDEKHIFDFRFCNLVPVYCNSFVEGEYLRFNDRFAYLDHIAMVCFAAIFISGAAVIRVVVADIILAIAAVFVVGLIVWDVCIRHYNVSTTESRMVKRAILHEVLVSACALLAALAAGTTAYAASDDCQRPGATFWSTTQQSRYDMCIHSIYAYPLSVIGLGLGFARPRLFVSVPAAIMYIVAKYAFRQLYTVDTLQEFIVKLVVDVVLSAIILFCHYSVETVHRKAFEAQIVNVQKQEQVNSQNGEMKKFIARMLPPDVCSRMLSHEQYVDRSETASVCILAFSDVECWAPREGSPDPEHQRKGAFRLVQLILQLDTITKFAVVERVRVTGDEYFVTSNVLEPTLSHALRASFFAYRSRLVVANSEIPVRCAVSSGKIIGSIVGANFRRYDISGSGVDEARHLIAVATPGEILMSNETVLLLGDRAETEAVYRKLPDQTVAKASLLKAIFLSNKKQQGAQAHLEAKALRACADYEPELQALDLSALQDDVPEAPHEEKEDSNTIGVLPAALHEEKESSTTIEVLPAAPRAEKRLSNTQPVEKENSTTIDIVTNCVPIDAKEDKCQQLPPRSPAILPAATTDRPAGKRRTNKLKVTFKDVENSTCEVHFPVTIQAREGNRTNATATDDDGSDSPASPASYTMKRLMAEQAKFAIEKSWYGGLSYKDVEEESGYRPMESQYLVTCALWSIIVLLILMIAVFIVEFHGEFMTTQVALFLGGGVALFGLAFLHFWGWVLKPCSRTFVSFAYLGFLLCAFAPIGTMFHHPSYFSNDVTVFFTVVGMMMQIGLHGVCWEWGTLFSLVHNIATLVLTIALGIPVKSLTFCVVMLHVLFSVLRLRTHEIFSRDAHKDAQIQKLSIAIHRNECERLESTIGNIIPLSFYQASFPAGRGAVIEEIESGFVVYLLFPHDPKFKQRKTVGGYDSEDTMPIATAGAEILVRQLSTLVLTRVYGDVVVTAGPIRGGSKEVAKSEANHLMDELKGKCSISAAEGPFLYIFTDTTSYGCLLLMGTAVHAAKSHLKGKREVHCTWAK